MAKSRKHGVWKYWVTYYGSALLISSQRKLSESDLGCGYRIKNPKSKKEGTRRDKSLIDPKTRQIIDTDEDWNNPYLERMSIGELQKTQKYLEKHVRRIGMTDRYMVNCDKYLRTSGYIRFLLKEKMEG